MFLRAMRRSSLLCKLAVNQVCRSAWLAVSRLDGLVVNNSFTKHFALHGTQTKNQNVDDINDMILQPFPGGEHSLAAVRGECHVHGQIPKSV